MSPRKGRRRRSGPGRSNRQPPGLPPLPRALVEAVKGHQGHQVLRPENNASLVFERYPRVWKEAHGQYTPADSEERKQFLENYAEQYRPAQGHRQSLRAVNERLDALADARRDYRSVGPMVTGLGADHPVENGFTFEPTLGVPTLAGTTIKGLARAAARIWSPDRPDLRARLLGSAPPRRLAERRDQGTTPGDVVFLDAWPIRWPSLALDIVNPHYPDYYRDQAAAPPGKREALPLQTERPIPVTFIVVAPDARYRFRLRIRPGGSATPKDLHQVWAWLDFGLRDLGIGAKTASGYGHLEPSEG